MADFNFDHALCVYLGGDPKTGEITIGGGDERLKVEFGADAGDIKLQLDQLLKSIVQMAPTGYTPEGESILAILANELPSLSRVCHLKIYGYVRCRYER